MSSKDHEGSYRMHSDRDYQVLGAMRYRSRERLYSQMNEQIIEIDLDPTIYKVLYDHANDAYEASLHASMAWEKMVELQKKFMLTVGGEDGSYLVGQEHVYNPEEHRFDFLAGEDKPAIGESVVVSQSQIARRTENGLDILLDAVVTTPTEYVLFDDPDFPCLDESEPKRPKHYTLRK